jgi:hypothetical protein
MRAAVSCGIKVLLSLLAFVLSLGAGILVAHDFTEIEDSSLLKYLVDSEVRAARHVVKARNVIYRSAPKDGNKKGLDSIEMEVEDARLAQEKLLNHFVGLGYKVVHSDALAKGDVDISVEPLSGGALRVTKYAWD